MRILVNGASGYFAGELIKKLDEDKRLEIIEMTSDLKKIARKDRKHIIVQNEKVLEEKENLPPIDIIVHTSFCRKSNGSQLVESLIFTRKMLHWAVENNVSGFINLSSQAVYGSDEGILPDETGEMNPDYLYAMAKCAAEMLVEEILDGKMSYSNIRLASLLGPSRNVPQNILFKFIRQALDGNNIHIVGGNQKFSFLDVRDAAEAIGLLIKFDRTKWKHIYNLGPLNQTTIIEMADIVCQKVEKLSGTKSSYELYPDEKVQLNAGMNSELIYKELNWKPKRQFENIVEDTIKYIDNYSVC